MLETIDINSITYAGAIAFSAFLLYQSGILQAWAKRITSKVNGSGTSQYRTNDGVQRQIDELVASLKVANHEMGQIQRDISTINANIDWIKNLLNKR